MAHLADDGLLAFHISNRHFNLEPALGRLAPKSAPRRHAYRLAGARERRGLPSSRWDVMTPHRDALFDLAARPGWAPTAVFDHGTWTNDFANVWAALTWGKA